MISSLEKRGQKALMFLSISARLVENPTWSIAMKKPSCDCLALYAGKEGWEEVHGVNDCDEVEIGWGRWCRGYSAVMMGIPKFCPLCGAPYKEDKP
jgi:hypothetical protein